MNARHVMAAAALMVLAGAISLQAQTPAPTPAQTYTTTCAACHGPSGAGIPAQFPRVAGQFPEYTIAQLQAFRAGERVNDPNKMMSTTVANMSDQEIKAVAEYITGLR